MDEEKKQPKNTPNLPPANVSKPSGPDSFGMPDLVFKPIQRAEEKSTPKPVASKPSEPLPAKPSNKPVQPAPKKKEEKKEKKPSGSRVKPIVWILTIVLVLLAAAAVFIYTSRDKLAEDWMAIFRKSAENAAKQEVEESVPPPSEEEMMVTPTEEPAAPSTELPTGVRYYIIVGGFAVQENATRYKETLEQHGYKSRVLDPEDGKPLYKVSVQDFATIDEALAAREELKQKFDLTIWVHKK
jgi:cell division protein FtsN